MIGREALAAAAALLLAIPAAAQDCPSIRDGAARLACFDKAHPARASKPQIGAATAEQFGYAQRLEKLFLEAGINLTATIFEKPHSKADRRKNFPALVIMGHINRVDVHHIQSKLGVIGEARKLGLKEVEFFGKTAGSWIFDLSRSPTCSQEFCFE